jgi:hypothetical protein
MHQILTYLIIKYVFYIYAVIRFSSSLRLIRQVETCRSYEILCIKKSNLILLHLLVLLYELFAHERT